MKKRERSGAAVSEEAEAKQRRVQVDESEENLSASELALKPFMGDLEEIQKQLQDLDEQCAHKQLEIQKAFDQKKKPVLEKRQRVLDKIPGFWGLALRNHPDLVLTSPDDVPVLKFLKEVDLDDNLDEAGSYRIKFACWNGGVFCARLLRLQVFSDEAKELFTPLELVKEVRFSHEDPEGSEVVAATEIQWRNLKDNPVAKAVAARAEAEDDEGGVWSIFEWFDKAPWPVTRGDVGEAIRRDIWHSPVSFFLGEAESDDEDDDDQLDDEDDDDELDDEEADTDQDGEDASAQNNNQDGKDQADGEEDADEE